MTVRGLAAVLVVSALVAAGCARGTRESAPRQDKVLVALALEIDAAGLAAKAEAVAEPFGTAAGEFLSLAQVRERFGASAKVADAAVAALKDLGIDAQLDPTGGVLWAQVDVSTAEEVFDVDLEVVESTSGAEVIAPDHQPKVPHGIRGVSGVIGLSGSLPATSASSSTTGASAARVGCPDRSMSRRGLGTTYGFDDLVGSGLTATGVTIRIVAAETYDPQVYDLYNECGDTTLNGDNVSVATVPLTRDAPGGTEVALDTVMVGLLVPDAQLEITEFDAASSIVFPLLQLLTDASSSGATPEVLMLTVGFCEDGLTDVEIAVGEWLLSALSATGTTAIAAAGDDGSSSCQPNTDAPAVQYPASSVWTSSTGGASYDGSGDSPGDLAVWNETPDTRVAGGGGMSKVIDRPSWQADTNQPGDKHLVPDFAAYAEPRGLGQVPACDSTGCRWQNLGGTSLSAAVLVGAAAVAGEHFAQGGIPRRFGHLAPGHQGNPDARNRVYTDITAGNNHVSTDRCCTATKGYDQASGWGLLNPDALIAVVESAASGNE